MESIGGGHMASKGAGSSECFNPCAGVCSGRIMCGSDPQAGLAAVGLNPSDYVQEPPYVYAAAPQRLLDPSAAASPPPGGSALASRLVRTLRVYATDAASEIMASDPRRSLPWYAVILLCGVLLVAGVVTLVSSRPATVANTSSTTAPPSTTSPLYDCKTDFSEWRTKWTLGQKAWCCHYFGKACPPASPAQAAAAAVAPAPAPGPAPAEFDCHEGASSPGTWLEEKRAYCCHHAGKGCHVVSGAKASGLYDCSEKFATWQSSWSTAKKLWCCESGAGTCPQKKLKK